jgi:hypothetical protein
MAITIGAEAIDRAGSFSVATRTCIQTVGAASETGTLTVFQLWWAIDATAVKVGTFSGSGTSYTNRDGETLGDMTAGSLQTFSGLNCDVTSGDFIGVHSDTGFIELTASGSAFYYYSGDAFGAGAKTYDTPGDRTISLYGLDALPASGPANLKSYNTNLKANIKTINTNAIANCKSLNTNV